MNGRSSLVALLLLALAYALVGASLAARPPIPFSGDQGLKLVQVDALVRGRAWIASEEDGDACARELPPYRPPFVYAVDGRWYSAYLNLLSYAGAALDRVAGARGLLLVPLASVLALLAATVRLGRLAGLDRPAAHGAAAVLLLATPLWLYGWTFWEHAPATLLAAAATIVVISARDAPAVPRAIAAGLLLGVGAAFRQETLLYAAALGLAIVPVARGLAAPAALLATAVAADLAVLRLLPGLPTGRQIDWIADLVFGGAARGGLTAMLIDRADVVRVLVAGAQRPIHAPVLAASSLAAVALFAAAIVPAALRGWRAWLALPVALGAAFAALPVAIAAADGRTQLKGLLPSAPLLVLLVPLAVAHLRTLWAERRGAFDRPAARQLVLTATALLALLLGLLLAPNDGGNEWGPRFLLPAFPALVCAGLAALGARRERLPHALCAVLVALGVVVQAIGVRAFVAAADEKRAALARIAALPGRYVVTPAWFVPQELSPLRLAGGKEMLLTLDERELRAAIDCIAARGESDIVYVDFAADEGRDPAAGDGGGRRFGPYLERQSFATYLHPFPLRVARFAR